MLISAFITHKKAETFKDCEDRFSVNPDTKSIAVSDGVSQSIFQKIWAEQLVKTYTSNTEWVPNIVSVRELTPQWRKKVDEYIENEKIQGRTPWRAENSINEGRSAGATILGLRCNDKKYWTYDVLGDSCLIRIKDNHIEEIISSESNKDFDNYTDYYDSDPKKLGKGTLRSESRNWSAGEVLLLVSDPFSDFLSKKRGTEDEPVLITKLLGINSHNEFESLVTAWRENGMHNDDSTLIIVKQDGSPDFHFAADCIDDIESLILNESADELRPQKEEELPISSEAPEPTDWDLLKDSFLKILKQKLTGKKFNKLSSKEQEEILNELVKTAKDFIESDGTTGNN